MAVRTADELVEMMVVPKDLHWAENLAVRTATKKDIRRAEQLVAEWVMKMVELKAMTKDCDLDNLLAVSLVQKLAS